jgi:tRNA pseudouridine38-40 synthase
MPRYFIEVSYKGTNYSGFQVQQNANSIQAEIEKALKIFFRIDIELTGASRTDTGVHALKNFFHFDAENLPDDNVLIDNIYNLNAILPDDIVLKRIYKVADNAHCRFDALSREYKYFIYQDKEPFLADRAYYFPYKLDIEKLQQAAAAILNYQDFTSFAKRNTQVKTFQCRIFKSAWSIESGTIVYNVQANRFLRGMVRGLVGTMLKAGAGKISLNDFIAIIENKNPSAADFSVPPQGLFLVNVEYPNSPQV